LQRLFSREIPLPDRPPGEKRSPALHKSRAHHSFQVSFASPNYSVWIAVTVWTACARRMVWRSLGQTEVQKPFFFIELFDGVCHILDCTSDRPGAGSRDQWRSVLRRFSDSSTTFRICFGWLLRAAALLVVEAELRCDNDLSRKGASASPTSSSWIKGR